LAVTTADFPTWTVTLVDQDSTPCAKTWIS